MEEFVEKDSFEFGNEPNNEESSFEYKDINGLGESNYENEDLFNGRVEPSYEKPEVSEVPQFNFNVPVENNVFNPSVDNDSLEDYGKVGEPIDIYKLPDLEGDTVVQEPPISVFDESSFNNSDFTFESFEKADSLEPTLEVEETQSTMPIEKIDREFLDENPETFSSSMSDNFEYDVVEPIAKPVVEEKKIETNIISDTPIEELNKLTEYKEEKISATDIKALFNKVGSNVQEASDIFVKNTEMKEKLDAKFEELKKLQETVENAKKTQYDEINAYKEEVYGKLTEKKQEVEDRINKLKEFQTNLEKEKDEFEKYKKEQKDEIERVQKEVQEAYESRREELNHIEDVLRKQKDSLDEERNQLSLDKIQYEADKNELANNLLKFNQIVDSFTIGMESTRKED